MKKSCQKMAGAVTALELKLRWTRRLVSLLLVASCAASGDSRASRQQCEQLRDHLIDVKLAAATGVDKAGHREAMRSALGADYVARCAEAVTDGELECALKASDDDALQACNH
jgi:hypothetical protein